MANVLYLYVLWAGLCLPLSSVLWYCICKYEDIFYINKVDVKRLHLCFSANIWTEGTQLGGRSCQCSLFPHYHGLSRSSTFGDSKLLRRNSTCSHDNMACGCLYNYLLRRVHDILAYLLHHMN